MNDARCRTDAGKNVEFIGELMDTMGPNELRRFRENVRVAMTITKEITPTLEEKAGYLLEKTLHNDQPTLWDMSQFEARFLRWLLLTYGEIWNVFAKAIQQYITAIRDVVGDGQTKDNCPCQIELAERKLEYLAAILRENERFDIAQGPLLDSERDDRRRTVIGGKNGESTNFAISKRHDHSISPLDFADSIENTLSSLRDAIHWDIEHPEPARRPCNCRFWSHNEQCLAVQNIRWLKILYAIGDSSYDHSSSPRPPLQKDSTAEDQQTNRGIFTQSERCKNLKCTERHEVKPEGVATHLGGEIPEFTEILQQVTKLMKTPIVETSKGKSTTGIENKSTEESTPNSAMKTKIEEMSRNERKTKAKSMQKERVTFNLEPEEFKTGAIATSNPAATGGSYSSSKSNYKPPGVEDVVDSETTER